MTTTSQIFVGRFSEYFHFWKNQWGYNTKQRPNLYYWCLSIVRDDLTVELQHIHSLLAITEFLSWGSIFFYDFVLKTSMKMIEGLEWTVMMDCSLAEDDYKKILMLIHQDKDSAVLCATVGPYWPFDQLCCGCCLEDISPW